GAGSADQTPAATARDGGRDLVDRGFGAVDLADFIHAYRNLSAGGIVGSGRAQFTRGDELLGISMLWVLQNLGGDAGFDNLTGAQHQGVSAHAFDHVQVMGNK